MSNTDKTPKSYEQRAASEPTDLHRNFAEWLFVQTGHKVDLKTVQLVCSMRMDFQKSDENQKHLAQRKAEAAAAKKRSAALKKAKLEAQLAKLKADLDKVDAPASAPVVPAETPAEPDKPARRTRKAVAKAPEAPAQPKARARRTAKKTTPDVPENFDEVDLNEPATPRVRRTRKATAKAPIAQ